MPVSRCLLSITASDLRRRNDHGSTVDDFGARCADTRIWCRSRTVEPVADETDFGYRAYDMPVDPEVPLDEVVGRWFRHLLVLTLRREMAAGATPRLAVAELLQVTDGHMGKKLAGTTSFTLEDVVRLLMAFGPELLPRFKDAEEMFPPSYRGRLRWDRRSGMAHPRVGDQPGADR